MAASALPPSADAAFDHRSGLARLRAGRADEALDLLEGAARAAPDVAVYAKDAGNACRALGRFDEAAEWYQRALGADADFIPALNNLAVLLRERGQPLAAESLLLRAVAVDPDDPDLWTNLGACVQQLSRLDDAIGYYRRALALNRHDAPAWVNLALALDEQRAPLRDVVECCLEAARLLPGQATPHQIHGRACLARRQFALAVAPLVVAAELDPANAEILTDLGVACIESGRNEDALRHFGAALELAPDAEFALYHQALALYQLGRHEQAIPIFDRLIAGRAEHGLEVSQAVWARLRGVHWRGLAEHETLLEGTWDRYPFNPYTSLVTPISARRQRAVAEKFAQYRYAGYAARRPVYPRPAADPGGRLRVAYYSADFREHAVAYLCAELLERHDRRRFEVIVLAYGEPEHGPMRRRIEAAADQVHDLTQPRGADAYEVAARIAALAPDVLVDLSGYTFGGWQEVLALRPAPVQASYIGYLGTSGGDFIDYLFSDAVITPPGSDDAYREALVRLPWYQANDRRRAAETPPDRAALGLPDDAVVYANLGQTYKLRPEVFAVWMRILERSPGAVLWLQGESPDGERHLREEAAARGVSPERLVFWRSRPRPAYLAALARADVFLDTWPYNAGATGSDALWMGVPLVSLPGDTFSSRYGASLLAAAGLPELIAADWTDYENIAVALGADRRRLGDYHQRLARRDSRLFDTPAFVDHWQSALAAMVARQRAGLPPVAIDLSAAGA